MLFECGERGAKDLEEPLASISHGSAKRLRLFSKRNAESTRRKQVSHHASISGLCVRRTDPALGPADGCWRFAVRLLRFQRRNGKNKVHDEIPSSAELLKARAVVRAILF